MKLCQQSMALLLITAKTDAVCVVFFDTKPRHHYDYTGIIIEYTQSVHADSSSHNVIRTRGH